MNRKEYERKTEKELLGRKVRLIYPLKNDYRSMPAGSIMTITGKGGGLHLNSEPCPRCGVALSWRKIPPSAVELLPAFLDALAIEPGHSSFALVKVPSGQDLAYAAAKPDIELVMREKVVIMPNDIDIYLGEQSVEVLKKLRQQIDDVLAGKEGAT